MTQAVAKSSIARLCFGAQQVGLLLNGQIIAVLVDDLDPAYFGMRVKVPTVPSSLSSNKGKVGAIAYEYYDVWVLKGEFDIAPGFIDVVRDTAPKD